MHNRSNSCDSRASLALQNALCRPTSSFMASVLSCVRFALRADPLFQTVQRRGLPTAKRIKNRRARRIPFPACGCWHTWTRGPVIRRHESDRGLQDSHLTIQQTSHGVDMCAALPVPACPMHQPLTARTPFPVLARAANGYHRGTKPYGADSPRSGTGRRTVWQQNRHHSKGDPNTGDTIIPACSPPIGTLHLGQRGGSEGQ